MKLFPWTGTGKVNIDLDSKGPLKFPVVAPTSFPDRCTLIAQESDLATNDLGVMVMTKVTCSAGMPWLEICGLYGSSVGLTESTFPVRWPSGLTVGAEVGVARGDPQPRANAPATSNAVTTEHERSTH